MSDSLDDTILSQEELTMIDELADDMAKVKTSDLSIKNFFKNFLRNNQNFFDARPIQDFFPKIFIPVKDEYLSFPSSKTQLNRLKEIATVADYGNDDDGMKKRLRRASVSSPKHIFEMSSSDFKVMNKNFTEKVNDLAYFAAEAVGIDSDDLMVG